MAGVGGGIKYVLLAMMQKHGKTYPFMLLKGGGAEAGQQQPTGTGPSTCWSAAVALPIASRMQALYLSA